MIFIGPSPEAISKMGTKDVARDTMKAGVPIVPGSQGIIKNTEEAIELANQMDIQLLLKRLQVAVEKVFVLHAMKKSL